MVSKINGKKWHKILFFFWGGGGGDIFLKVSRGGILCQSISRGGYFLKVSGRGGIFEKYQGGGNNKYLHRLIRPKRAKGTRKKCQGFLIEIRKDFYESAVFREKIRLVYRDVLKIHYSRRFLSKLIKINKFNTWF